MWVFTTQGFYSVVEDTSDRSRFVVRARVREDLENLRPLIPDLKIVVLKNRDYEYRAYVERSEWIAALAILASEVSYSNFKDEVTRRQGKKRHDVYLRVWGILTSLAPYRPVKQETAGSRLFDDIQSEPWDDGIFPPRRTSNRRRRKKGARA